MLAYCGDTSRIWRLAGSQKIKISVGLFGLMTPDVLSKPKVPKASLSKPKNENCQQWAFLVTS